MELRGIRRLRRLGLLVVFASMVLGAARGVGARPREHLLQAAQPGAPPAAANPATRPVGTIKTITGKTIVLTTDAGAEVTIEVQDDARLVRIAPGQKDLKDAAPIQLADLQPGDRILVRGKMADDGKAVVAASVIAMKQTDIAMKLSHERDEWQKHGAGERDRRSRRHDQDLDKRPRGCQRREYPCIEANRIAPIRAGLREV
jgi:hypothetical protein